MSSGRGTACQIRATAVEPKSSAIVIQACRKSEPIFSTQAQRCRHADRQVVHMRLAGPTVDVSHPARARPRRPQATDG